MKSNNETAEAIREMLTLWNTVYAEAIRKGPHNPEGTSERAEQLTRAYMSGKLRLPLQQNAR